jgi:prolipoprotein diacylglyceryl transferase
LPTVWDVDPVIFTVPGIDWPIRWYGMFFALAFLAGFSLFRWQMERGGRGADEAASFIIPGFIGTIAGARAGHILFYNLDYFLNDPTWFFRIWEGGLASHGATLGLLAALFWQSWRTKVPFWELSDRFTFSAAAGAAFIRVGNLFNSEIVGKIAAPGSAFGVKFPRYDSWTPLDLVPPRYPTQILEFLLGVLVFLSLLAADRALGRERRPRGALTAVFMLVYFAGRFCVEFLKERQNELDTLALSRGQMLSVLPFLLGAGLLIWSLTKAGPSSAAYRASGSRKAVPSGGAGVSGGKGKDTGKGKGKGKGKTGAKAGGKGGAAGGAKEESAALSGTGLEKAAGAAAAGAGKGSAAGGGSGTGGGSGKGKGSGTGGGKGRGKGSGKGGKRGGK